MMEEFLETGEFGDCERFGTLLSGYIERAKERHGVTYDVISRQMYTSIATVGRWVNNRNLPSLKQIEQLQTILACNKVEYAILVRAWLCEQAKR